MKVDWKPFDENDATTWPPHGSVVWLTNGVNVCLAGAEIHTGGISWPYFDAYNTTGADCELWVDSDNATHWAPAELPELPE